MIRLNGKDMRQKLAYILVSTGEERNRTVNGKNGGKGNGVGTHAGFKVRSY